MKYSNTTTKDGIIQTIEELTDLGDAYISGDTTRLRQTTARVNRALSSVWHLIHNATGNWKYDDSNQTDLPYATANLVSGQDGYVLPTDILSVERVEIKDENDNWVKIHPLTEVQIPGAIDEFQETDGAPFYYTLVGNVITLYPASDYSQDVSLKVYYSRKGVEFAYDDTTDEPGFASLYHQIIPIKASIEWYKVKQPNSPTLQILMMDEAKLEAQIKEHYSKRFKDHKPRIKRAYKSYK
jgi:hypothetical protein